jgi:hypothetical protein
MRAIWWYAIAVGVALVAIVIAGVLVFGGSGGTTTTTVNASGCPPPASTQSAGNAKVSATTVGRGPNRVVVIRAQDKRTGVPVHNGAVTIQGTMDCPHLMRLFLKDLHEASKGTYKGAYNLFMPGQWTINIVVRSKQGDATTSALPVTVRSGG